MDTPNASMGFKIAGLISKYLRKELTDAEWKYLEQWINDTEANAELFDQLVNSRYLEEESDRLISYEKEKAWKKIQNNSQIRPVTKTKKVYWMAAAAILLLITSVATFIFTNDKPPKQVLTRAQDDEKIGTNILPGENKATLTLADGSVIELDSVDNGALAQQGNTKIIKLNTGSLAYNKGTGSSPLTMTGEALYNTISTPRGGQYQVVLPDGSRVWLNAESSIRFSTAFVKKRNVTVIGEVFFEIASNSKMPFRVQTGKMEINVLGTSFNVMAYPEEALIKTTLVNGKVQIKKGTREAVLIPGQNAECQRENDLILVNDHANIDEIIAWKNGFFKFRQASLESIMAQLSRWYKLEVVYKGKVNDRFAATIPRDVPLSQVLEILQLTEKVHFTIDGNKITVMPWSVDRIIK